MVATAMWTDPWTAARKSRGISRWEPADHRRRLRPDESDRRGGGSETQHQRSCSLSLIDTRDWCHDHSDSLSAPPGTLGARWERIILVARSPRSAVDMFGLTLEPW